MKLPIINSLDLGLNKVKGFKDEMHHSFSSENSGTTIGGFGKAGKKIYEYGFNEYYSKSSFESIKSNYFNWLISSNDLIFYFI